MHAPKPPAPTGKGRPGAIMLLAAASILYGLSLVPWLLMLIMSPMLYDSERNVGTANVLILGLLGWPVVILGGLIFGWIRRTMRTALIVTLAPLVWALVIAGWVEVVNPQFFNIADFMPAPRTLAVEDRQLAGLSLGAEPGAVVKELGLPGKARVDGADVAPDQAAAETVKLGVAMWEYPAGVAVHFSEGKVSEIELDLPHPGKTARGVALGDTMDRVRAVYGESESVTTSTGPDGESQTYHYYGKGFTLIIGGDESNRVEWVTVRTEE